eukprot:gnl/MRDRNA2_/MRDRNA2_129792_c0_seq1.p1 gnl/MRDRNA2_/MRDRNA2_129792_c0~~gnl/MRDRNA2_/MRDRNA2_129792_c0_seq1.p1  ORF type:complete len:328 (-),score=79.52 gnl/MRDRNA2_/MRDRNA2_129792_c0_seq1:33-944(-)
MPWDWVFGTDACHHEWRNEDVFSEGPFSSNASLVPGIGLPPHGHWHAKTKIFSGFLGDAADPAKHEPWKPSEVPHPREDPEGCGQSGASDVCDPDGVLGPDVSKRIRKALVKVRGSSDFYPHSHSYPGCIRNEMAVVVVNKVQGNGSEAALEEFADGVEGAWRVSKCGCKNSVVLAESADDEQVAIVVGRGAKQYVPDYELRAVIARLKPLMAQHRFTEAAEQGVADMADVLHGHSVAFNHLTSTFIGWVDDHRVMLSCVVALWLTQQVGKAKKSWKARRQMQEYDNEEKFVEVDAERLSTAS